ncbi:MAG: hypothetical protein R2729_09245 [Bryobacteraceae bacterium]
MDARELERRRPVWIALAELFLDTDVRLWYVGIVRVLAESPYTVEELGRILRDEVTPALQSNLMQVAGEWAGFDDEWVVAEITRKLDRRLKVPNVVDMSEDWAALAELIGRVRGLPDAEARARRLSDWGELLTILVASGYRSPEKTALDAAEAERILRDDLMPVMMPGVRRLAKTHPGAYPSETEIEERWRRFAGELERKPDS